MNRTFVFDAVGTLLRPIPDVITAYRQAGLRHGSSLDRQEVAARFKIARRRYFNCDTSAEATGSGSLVSSDDIERELWRSLIGDVFHDVVAADELFQQLWAHFALPESWGLYDDVAECLNCIAVNDQIVIASNFDSRLLAIVAAFSELNCVSEVHCSAAVGFRKPDPMFYQHVAGTIRDNHTVIMVGDDLQNDCLAPERLAWQGIWLDRDGTDQNLDSAQRLTSLSQILAMSR